MKSKSAIRIILVRVATYLRRNGEGEASSDLMDYIIKHFPIFT